MINILSVAGVLVCLAIFGCIIFFLNKHPQRLSLVTKLDHGAANTAISATFYDILPRACWERYHIAFSEKEIRGLTKGQAQDLLDWLENHDYDHDYRVGLEEDGFTIVMD